MLAKYVDWGFLKHKADYYSRALDEIFRDHVPVFSHADFQRKNIMFRNSTTAMKDETLQGIADQELVIIDWKSFGWYPDYWKYTKAMLGCGKLDDDWSYCVDRMLEPRRTEFAWMLMLLREYWS